MNSGFEYKAFADELTSLYYNYNELIYLCDNFDINRINNFLINIIEYNDFYIDDGDKGELSNGYSDMSDFDKLSNIIIATDDYNNMIDYMDYNLENLFIKHEKFIENINNFHGKYLGYFEDTKPDIDVIEKIKIEYKIVISNLEELQQRLLEIIDNDIVADTVHGININVVLITNNSLLYKTIDCWYIKRFLIKNLHIINKETYEITNSDLIEFKNKFYKIYSNVHKDFLNKLNDGIATYFNEEFIDDLKKKEKIKKYREIFKEVEKKAESKLEEEKVKAAEKEATKKEEETNKRNDAILKQTQARVNADTAKQAYNAQLAKVEGLKTELNAIEGKTVLVTTKSSELGVTNLIEAITGMIPGVSGYSGKTDNDGEAGEAGKTGNTDEEGKDGEGDATIPPRYSIKYVSIDGIEQGNIPDNIWKIIIINEPIETRVKEKWNDIIKRWQDKFTKDAENKKKWDEERANNNGEQINDEVKFEKEEKIKRDYWENILKKPDVTYGYTKYSIKPLAELYKILLIGEIPYESKNENWNGEITKKLLEGQLNDGKLVWETYVKHKKNLIEATERYYKHTYGKEIDDDSNYYSNFNIIKREFLELDDYYNNILNEDYVYDKEESEDEKQKSKFSSTKTTRTRFYLDKTNMEFYYKYIDVFNSYDNLNDKNKNLNINFFELPEPSDDKVSITNFKRLDRFLAKIYNIRKNSDDKERNIIVFPENEKITYTKYIDFFNTHYKDLEEGKNLIFQGDSYKLKKATELTVQQQSQLSSVQPQSVQPQTEQSVWRQIDSPMPKDQQMFKDHNTTNTPPTYSPPSTQSQSTGIKRNITLKNGVKINQRNIPDDIWIRILDFRGTPEMTSNIADVIEKWNTKYTDNIARLARWEKEEGTNPAKVKKERDDYNKEEQKKKDYWDNEKKKDTTGAAYRYEIYLIGKIPSWLEQRQLNAFKGDLKYRDENWFDLN